MADNEVSLAVRWSELGGDVPARAKKGLDDLKRGADDAAPSVGDRMATAFQRLEAREPTMVLRRARLAIEELGASALGVQGPLGRMAASLAMLIPGGALTLGIVAGVGLIGYEIKKIIDYPEQLEQNLLKLNTSISHGRAGPLFAAMGMQHRIDQLSDPGIFRTIGNTFADLFTGDISSFFSTGAAAKGPSAAAMGRSSELSTLQTGQDLLRQDFIAARVRQEKEYTKTLAESGLAVMKAELGLHPTNAALELLAQWTDSVHVSTMKLNSADEKAYLANERRTRTLERETAVLKEQEAILTKAGFTTPGITMTENQRAAMVGLAGQIPGVGPERRGGLEGQGAAVAFGQGGVGIMAFRGGVGGAAPRNLGGGEGVPAGLQAGGGLIGITPLGQQQLAARDLAETNKDATLSMRLLERSITGLTSVILGASRGGVSGGIQAVGGVLSTLSALGKVGAAGLEGALPALGPVGTVISAVGALTSLFHGSGPKPKVIITAFEEQAREQIQQIRGDPATTSFVILGPDGQATAYSLARLASRGVIPRFPGSR